ncbi:hypothetical protein C8J57DRAFT_1530086 [Mycena rebaudengoi]|nr:hypothetical protein C8J57DRAFT_1530086 [Mycena rebaudengoi]
MILPALPAESITVRKYEMQARYHPHDQCLCWVGPALQEAAEDYKAAQINPSKLSRAHLSCMGGDASMKSINSSSTAMDVDMPPKPPTAPAAVVNANIAPGPQGTSTSTTPAVVPGQSNGTLTVTQPQPVHTSSVSTNGAVASTSAIPIAAQPHPVKVVSPVKATAVRPSIDEAARDREGLARFGLRQLALADSELELQLLNSLVPCLLPCVLAIKVVI